jgi:hypothetical protein
LTNGAKSCDEPRSAQAEATVKAESGRAFTRAEANTLIALMEHL